MKTQDRILMAHGGGGRLTRDLIADEIATRFDHPALSSLPDAATLELQGCEIAFTTDSYVVQPLEFPGGNIGHLAVHGTVNDLAVSGAIPAYLSIGLIVEEGLPLATFRRILDSIRAASEECNVAVVTGDTKVVAHGQCDGLYINSAGIGMRMPEFSLHAASLTQGDCVLVSGTVAEHGLAVMSTREGIDIENGPTSDTAPVHRLVCACRDLGSDIRFMRDPTRGGLATVLNEITADSGVGIHVREEAIPLSRGGRAVVELLGLDPLHVASEGRLVMVCDASVVSTVLDRWRAMPEGQTACCIGEVTTDAARVIMTTLTGGRRLVDVPRGELLPRIC
jgi:hydrogenase expression/formation protein HypE